MPDHLLRWAVYRLDRVVKRDASQTTCLTTESHSLTDENVHQTHNRDKNLKDSKLFMISNSVILS